MGIRRDLKLVPAPGIEFRSLGNGAVLVNMTSGGCFELNRIGSAIWSRLQQGASVGDLISDLTVRYGITADAAERDMVPWIESLRAAGLLSEDL